MQTKSIQMDSKMIEAIEKKMFVDKNFSFQSVAREIIQAGLEMQKIIPALKDMYLLANCLTTNTTDESAKEIAKIIHKIDPDWLLEAIEIIHKERMPK